MPFCTQCGHQVGEKDRFCAKCGLKQTAAVKPNIFANINSRTASLLCYIPLLGWIAAICVLATNRFRQDREVRFHAFQGLYLFVAYLLVDWVLSPMLSPLPRASERMAEAMLRLVIYAAWIFMIVKVAQDQTYRLPVVGELAERSIAEQRQG